MNYRLRSTDDGLLVLQVIEYPKHDPYVGYQTREPTWRDAKVTDIPVYDLFKAPETEKYSCAISDQRSSGWPFDAINKTCGNGSIG